MRKRRFLKFLGACAVSVLSIYAINTYLNKKACEKKLLPAGDDDFYEWKGLKVYCKRIGSGSPMILLHDLDPICSAEDWNSVIDELSNEHRLYIVDLPGCGRSDKPQITYTNFYYVQFLLDLIKNEVGEKCEVIASGDSSAIALMAAVYDKSKISRIQLLSPPAIEDQKKLPDQRGRFIKRVLELPVIGRLAYHLQYRRDSVDDQLCEFFFNPFLVDEHLLSAHHESAHLKNESGRYLAGSICANYTRIDITHALRSLAIPLRILVGVPSAGGEAVCDWAEIQPAVELSGIERAGRMMQFERPGEVAAAILA